MKYIYYSSIFLSHFVCGQTCLSDVVIVTDNYSVGVTKSSTYVTISSSVNGAGSVELDGDPVNGYVLMNPGFIASPSPSGAFVAQTLECGSLAPQKINIVSNDAPFNIKVYPNPTEQLVNISFGKQNDTSFIFEIYDASGKILINKNIKKGIEIYNIDISDFVSGSYIYKIKSNSYIKTGIIIKK
ncbi:T9SS type A sorting domain-containing protein [Epilithonimonas sp. UC225_85]|uniref:T9SS type A sorting domain-containing protein n=1 Tax=Epilithonimonas sp. UC225_85 TaxID=3350167 RepID=UPI0036D26643